MADRSLNVGNINDNEGELFIAGGDIYKGYTPEQVSVLIPPLTGTPANLSFALCLEYTHRESETIVSPRERDVQR